jgi:hypothetical protein
MQLFFLAGGFILNFSYTDASLTDASLTDASLTGGMLPFMALLKRWKEPRFIFLLIAIVTC